MGRRSTYLITLALTFVALVFATTAWLNCVDAYNEMMSRMPRIGKDGYDSSESVMNTFFADWSLLLVPITLVSVVLLTISLAMTLEVLRTEVALRHSANSSLPNS